MGYYSIYTNSATLCIGSSAVDFNLPEHFSYHYSCCFKYNLNLSFISKPLLQFGKCQEQDYLDEKALNPLAIDSLFSVIRMPAYQNYEKRLVW